LIRSSGFFVFLEIFMRTYDKLIATIFARRAVGDLRPLPGAGAPAATAAPQEAG
jgi:hypothetical protein